MTVYYDLSVSDAREKVKDKGLYNVYEQLSLRFIVIYMLSMKR